MANHCFLLAGHALRLLFLLCTSLVVRFSLLKGRYAAQKIEAVATLAWSLDEVGADLDFALSMFRPLVTPFSLVSVGLFLSSCVNPNPAHLCCPA